MRSTSVAIASASSKTWIGWTRCAPPRAARSAAGSRASRRAPRSGCAARRRAKGGRRRRRGRAQQRLVGDALAAQVVGLRPPCRRADAERRNLDDATDPGRLGAAEELDRAVAVDALEVAPDDGIRMPTQLTIASSRAADSRAAPFAAVVSRMKSMGDHSASPRSARSPAFDDAVAAPAQGGDDGAADAAGRAADEDSHGRAPTPRPRARAARIAAPSGREIACRCARSRGRPHRKPASAAASASPAAASRVRPPE